MICPHCHKPLPDEDVLSAAGSISAGMAVNPGRKPVMRLCPRCGGIHSAREMRRCRHDQKQDALNRKALCANCGHGKRWHVMNADHQRLGDCEHPDGDGLCRCAGYVKPAS
jgi:predicted RNA-binding Zn-ribbon protein involved in translation (DUF1610 family)